MAIIYVDPDDGSDTYNGLGANADDATNKPLATVSKAIAGSTPIASDGDLILLKPAFYREIVNQYTGSLAPTGETILRGDFAGAADWKNRPTRRRPVFTAWLSGPTSAPSSSTLITVSGHSFWTFEDLEFWRYSGRSVQGSKNGSNYSTNLTFRRCDFMQASASGSNAAIQITVGANTPAHLLFEDCHFQDQAAPIALYIESGSTDTDVDIIMRNCRSNGTAAAVFQCNNWLSDGGGRAYGILVQNYSGIGGIVVAGSYVRSSTPGLTVRGCVIITGSTGITANVAGQIDEDYNVINAQTARSNVTAGSNSVVRYELDIEMGLSFHCGEVRRPKFMPRPDSPLLYFDGQSSPPSADAAGVTRPPSSTGGTCGALLPWMGRQSSTVAHGGTYSLAVDGYGHHEFEFFVDAAETTVSVWARYDSNYDDTGGALPTLRIIDSTAGISGDTAVMTAAADTWQQLSITFTPTRAGKIRVRFEGFTTAASGISYWDDWSAA